MFEVLAASVFLYMCFVAWLYFVQRNLIYNPSMDRVRPSSSANPNMYEISVKTSDGLSLISWYQNPSISHKGIIVFFHGNTGSVADRDEKVKPYIDSGYGVLLVGYRGFGGNPGRPSENGLYEDGRAVLRFLNKNTIPEARWIFYGESLGTAIAVHLAFELSRMGTPIQALILEAPFTSMSEMAARSYPYIPARYLVKDKFNSLAKISVIQTPLLILHGECDEVVNVDLGKSLFDSAQGPKEGAWFPEAGHNNLYNFGAFKVVLNFLDNNCSKFIS